MSWNSLLLPTAAALALAAGGPALAQHDHGSTQGGGMHGGMMNGGTMHGGAMHAAAKGSAAGGIAEGILKNGVRTVELSVTDNGFEPSKVKANKGEKVRLVVTRKTDSTCAKEIVIKDHGINQPLPLNKAVTVEFTPTKSGEIRYACGMDHVSGIVFIP